MTGACVDRSCHGWLLPTAVAADVVSAADLDRIGDGDAQARVHAAPLLCVRPDLVVLAGAIPAGVAAVVPCPSWRV